MIGQVIEANGASYEITKLLGKGKGGYSYLASSGGRMFVLKKMHYEPCAYYQFEDDKLGSELRSYQTLRDIGITIPEMFYHHQAEQYLIKEFINGDTLAGLAARNQIEDSHIAQIFTMCQKLYAHPINIDYFPTNFVVQQGIVYYIDYECSPYSDEWNFENWGIYFLVNAEGMAHYLNTGSDASLIENGKPIKRGFEETVARLRKEFCPARIC